MAELKIEYPIYTIDNKLLLPAGTALSDDTMDGLITSNRVEKQTGILLEYGTIKKDILQYLDHDNYRQIFDDKYIQGKLLKKMLKARLPLSVLESLYSFKEYDFYTYRHHLMVFALSTLLADELIKDNDDIMEDIVSAPTHDIGKRNVPINILNKVTPLTQREKRILKNHTLAGYVLLSYYFQDRNNKAAIVARDHHERLDGSGYPRGISVIDRMVELVVVTDVYDALMSPRPYRHISFDKRTALEEITQMAKNGLISWEVVKALINQNRRDRSTIDECLVSMEVRGKSPDDNLYGITLDLDTE